jgi:methyltransferase (TIGR00027 family)
MKEQQSSATAEQMALSRAIESRKPQAERICWDPLAERFLGRRYKALLFTRPLRDAVEKLIERMFAGHHYYVVARTRYIDDFLLEQLKREPGQLVILGAGYDSRASRFAERLQNVAVFEIDHPATSRAKQHEVGSAFGGTRVNYVPVDFNVERLSDRLRQAGYADTARTVFLWEGVTPYLPRPAIDDVLRFVASSSGPGSVILFDYILQSVVDGTCEMPGASTEFTKMQRTSEPLVSGFAEGQIGPYLEARGFDDVVDIGADGLKRRYFDGAASTRYVKPWWRIVHAARPSTS